MSGQHVSIYEIKSAYERLIERRVRKIAIYRLLHRHKFWKFWEKKEKIFPVGIKNKLVFLGGEPKAFDCYSL